MMFTTSVDETRKWMEMITMAQEEYRSLRSSSYNDFGLFILSFYLIKQTLDSFLNTSTTTFEREKQQFLMSRKDTFNKKVHSGQLQNRISSFNANNTIINGSIAHRKSHSMDSQVMAAAFNNRPCSSSSNSIRKFLKFLIKLKII